MASLSLFALLASLAAPAIAVNGGSTGTTAFTYTAQKGASVLGGNAGITLKSASYQYTGLGTAESSLEFGSDGTLFFSPAISKDGQIGFVKSKDQGQSWQQILPGGKDQGRAQPVLALQQGRYFFWSSGIPGLRFSYSDDGTTFSAPLEGGNFFPKIQDWAKLVSGKPVTSKLSGGASEVLYLSAPSLISTPIPFQPIGPIRQLIMKSTDKGATWTQTKGTPPLNPAKDGGACAGQENKQEYIIWGAGFVAPNGTVVYGLRRCRKISLAISHDEGDTWGFSDVPGSDNPPFDRAILTYLQNGNVIVPDPVSIDAAGNFYAIWSDAKYALQLSRSTDFGRTWSDPVVIGAPTANGTAMTYLPKLRHHPTQAGRAAVAYYGSADGGKTYEAYIGETANIGAATPVFSGIIANSPSLPMQKNKNGKWDQGYGYPFWDLVEFVDIQYAPANSGFGTDTLVAAFARSMCSAQSLPPAIYDAKSCEPGWDYKATGKSRWQGYLAAVKH